MSSVSREIDDKSGAGETEAGPDNTPQLHTLGKVIVTAAAVGEDDIIVATGSAEILVYDAVTWHYRLSLLGHEGSMWDVAVIAPKDDSVSNGIDRTLVVSAGSDHKVWVWDVATGECELSMPGHTGMVRCLAAIEGRATVLSGSRDCSVRVWDIEQGELLRVLHGHEDTVRCIEAVGDRAVSASYDQTCRIWDVDSGECLHVLQGHGDKIYSLAFDGARVYSGSLDKTVRVWDAASGDCVATLQDGSLVSFLRIAGDRLVSGSAGGEVAVYSLGDWGCLHRIAAHGNAVTGLQADSRYIVSGGDGVAKLWDIGTGELVRELTKPYDIIYQAGLHGNTVVVAAGPQDGNAVVEIRGVELPGEAEK